MVASTGELHGEAAIANNMPARYARSQPGTAPICIASTSLKKLGNLIRSTPKTFNPISIATLLAMSGSKKEAAAAPSPPPRAVILRPATAERTPAAVSVVARPREKHVQRRNTSTSSPWCCSCSRSCAGGDSDSGRVPLFAIAEDEIQVAQEEELDNVADDGDDDDEAMYPIVIGIIVSVHGVNDINNPARKDTDGGKTSFIKPSSAEEETLVGDAMSRDWSVVLSSRTTDEMLISGKYKLV